jgi:DNA-binding transcriptional LysR family regulator
LLTESRAARSGTLHIVSNSALHMLNVLARFREKYPGVWVMISHDNTHTVTESLFRYDTDIAILGELTHPGRT